MGSSMLQSKISDETHIDDFSDYCFSGKFTINFLHFTEIKILLIKIQIHSTILFLILYRIITKIKEPLYLHKIFAFIIICYIILWNVCDIILFALFNYVTTI